MLRQLLGGAVDDGPEKYGLTWHGKRQARQLALTPSTGTLLPRPEESVDWDTTRNLVIEGDNLEVLKLLQKSYAGKVKLIYIDPPYNEGGDYVYPDDFTDNVGNYLALTSQVSGDGRRLSTNQESSGRFHTEWLNMMYPRLRLARNLLRDDGAIFMSISDVESHNLRTIADDVFGPECFVAAVIWKKKSSPDARSTIGSVHDTILCYVRDADMVKDAIGKMQLGAGRIDAYSNPDEDPRGDWASVDMTGMTGRATAEQFFKVTLPSGRIIGPPEGRSWGLIEATFDQLRADGRIWFGRNGDSVPRIKKFLNESDGQAIPSLWDLTDVGSNEEAKKEVNELFGEPDVFDTPKPVRLVRRMLDVAASSGQQDVVLDFFAGSGTTGHALMAAAAEGGASRRFVLVQLPQPLDPETKNQRIPAAFCDKLGRPRNIAELTKERLRRAGTAVRKENPMFAGDVGFRTFKLETSNIRPWSPTPDDFAGTLLANADHLVPGRSEQDVLFELLLKLGLELTVLIETVTVAGKAVHAVGAGALLACLTDTITRADAEPLALGLVALRDRLAPSGRTDVVFRDSAFADDVAKTNLAAILEQHGLTNVRSL